MNEKLCSKCQIPKPLPDFATDSRLKSGKKNVCKQCDTLRASQYQKRNLVSVLIKNKKWYHANPEKILARRPRQNSYRRQKYNHDEQFKKRIIANVQKYRDNPKNKATINAKKRELRNKYAQNPVWRAVQNLRRRLNFALHGKRKADNTMKLVGCDAPQLREHLQSLFQPGMSWDNYGQWHIDHIKPCASFDMSKPEDQAQCFHYTNLQPLWSKDNLSKGAQLI